MPTPSTDRRVLVVQHTTVCPPLRVGEWLRAAGGTLDVVRADLGEPLPASLDGYAGLLVLGGEMGANDDADHPWLAPTKALLALGVAGGVPTLGICLGHQLLAVATGGVVDRTSSGPQLGLRRVGPTPAATDDPLLGGLPAGAPAVHWNSDSVVTLPPAAALLAVADGIVQAIRVGPRAWGLQWHPEVDAPTLRLWAEADVRAGRLDAERAETLLATTADADAALQATWRPVLERFAALLIAP